MTSPLPRKDDAMLRAFHPIRALALLLLICLLVGVPWAVIATVGVPFPAPTQVAAAWNERRVPGDLVVQVGAALFALLWAWFAATAVGEFAHVRSSRSSAAGDQLAPLAPGPARWVRMLVRVVAISSLSATATMSVLAPALRSTAAQSVRSVVVAGVFGTDADDRVAPAVHIASGRDTPYSLASAIGRAELRDRIIEQNTGRTGPDGTPWTSGVFPAGMQVLLPEGVQVPTNAPRSVGEVIDTATGASSSSGVVPFASGLGTALVFSAGAVSLLEARRRRQWRAAGLGARPVLPQAQAVRAEAVLRSLSAAERVARVDIALRASARELALQGRAVHAAVLGDTGELLLHLNGPATAAAPWTMPEAEGTVWRLGGEVSLADLAVAAQGCGQPCPAMVHLGGAEAGGEVFVDLEAVGSLTVQSPWSVPLLRAIACSLAVSPFVDVARVFTVGLGDELPGGRSSEASDSFDAALDAAAMTLGTTPSMATSTFALRSANVGGEAWEPAIVVAAGDDVSEAAAAGVERTGSGRGLAVVVDTPGLHGGWSLQYAGDHHLLQPLGLRVHPVGLTCDDLEGVRMLLDEADLPLPVHAEVVPIAPPMLPATPFEEPEWGVLVKVLGQVEVVAASGVQAAFERSKSLELVVWLSQHRERPTRTAARTALWDLDVRDATFANVVSDARRALARAAAPADGEEWIGRTLTEDLPLHEGVITDAALLAARLQHARSLPSAEAVEVLRPGVELLTGLPFAGTSFLWTDAEGITSSLVLLATGAAIELANHHLALGDIDGVFWATGQGLKVLAGHEELIALRMRAHARRGDLAGVRGEWESYERALAADPWAAAEPAPKLVALRRELMGGERGPARERALA
ncbi:MAG: hypothetical protein Q7V57_08070 [Actinomycetota bacterium]|nr:hypothetical protein [Actinomycetota bacterium]